MARSSVARIFSRSDSTCVARCSSDRRWRSSAMATCDAIMRRNRRPLWSSASRAAGDAPHGQYPALRDHRHVQRARAHQRVGARPGALLVDEHPVRDRLLVLAFQKRAVVLRCFRQDAFRTLTRIGGVNMIERFKSVAT